MVAIRPSEVPRCSEDTSVTANIKKFTISNTVVAGARPLKRPETPRPAAASENVRLVPHSWQRVALTPTSVPHAGHIFGRGASSFPPKNRWKKTFILFTRNCHS